MDALFGNTLRNLRIEKGLSQNQLAIQLFVTKSTVARWENGRRLPDAIMITRLSKVLGVDVSTFFSAAAKSDNSPNLIIVDDNKIDISESIFALEEAMPNAAITGFNRRKESIEYARAHRIDLAFLDIELGTASGLDLCRELLEINPCTNVIYLTAYPDYSLNAWDTGACGFMVKPLTPEGIRRQLDRLRSPIQAGGA